MRTPTIFAGGLAAAAAAAVAVGLTVAHADTPPLAPTSTPIKHVVVLFDENESFDHYFATYPNAANPPGQPKFVAKDGTPSVNGLDTTLLNNNPNSSPPQRLDRSEAVTCSQNHGYGAEQSAFDGGLMDKFPEFTAGGSCGPRGKSIVMDYFDGNTVTGLWNLAQNFSMSDNSFDTNFGPSTVGAINLISGQTHGADVPFSGVENNTVIGDPQPFLDDCNNAAGGPGGGIQMSGTNIGDIMSARKVTWGWFQGGFKPSSVDASGKATCATTHHNVANATIRDYVQHHEPFQYYRSTANPHHLPPSSVDAIGTNDQANHQYDLSDFDKALAAGNLPSVSFLKAAAFEDGHPSNSDPLDEQRFIARTLNALEQSPEWSSTAVVIAYDDSDGWYDHVMSPITSPSAATSDSLNGPQKCGNVPASSTAYPDRCAYGPRQPLLVISPYSKVNFVDHSLTDQTSVLKFIEDNWQLGRIGDQSFDARAGSIGNMLDFNPDAARAPKVFLDPATGLVTKNPPNDTPSGGPTATPTATPSPSSTSVTTTVGGTVEHGNADDLPLADAAPVPTTGKAVVTTSGKPAKLKLSCSTKGSGKKVSVSCSATGTDAKSAGIAVRFRIAKGKSILATTATKLSKGKAKATLRSKKALKGKYTLRIAITHKGGVTGISQSIRL
jgi:phospholipase C